MRAYRTRSNLDEEKRRPKPAPRVGLISFGSRYEGAPLQTTPLHFAIEWPERSGTAPRAAYAQSPRWVKSCPDSPKDRLPLYPRKRTQDGHRAMSEKCQFQTHAPRQKAQCVGRVLTSSRRADDFRCAPDDRRKQGLQTPPSLERTMAGTAPYVRCSSRAVSSLGMWSIPSCPYASSSRHQRRSPASA